MAKVIIPPDRSNISSTNSPNLKVCFEKYKNGFLEPLFRIFPKLAIHDAVYLEVSHELSIKQYVDEKISKCALILLKDEDLNTVEGLLRDTAEEKISQFTNYSPDIDNSSDRGEVKSLSYAVAKNLVYFSTNDSNAISLIERNELEPYLHSLEAIRLYELLYAIRTFDKNSNILKGLYKLLYYLTKYEKKTNYDWATFNEECNKHY